jgi:hypothetical protein
MAGSKNLWIEVPASTAHANTAVLFTGDGFPDLFWDNVEADGADIIIYDNAGNKLTRQLVAINTGAKTMELYVKSPSSDTEKTFLRMNYDDAGGAEVNDFADYEDYYEQYSARVAASADDCYIQWSGAVWQIAALTTIYQIAGYGAATQQKAGGWMRFLALGIPQNSHACNMNVTFTCNVANANVDVNTRFTGQKSGTPDTFSDLADYQARRGTVVGGANDDYITTAQVDWDGMAAWVAETEYTSPELKTIAQEVFDNSAVTNMVVFWDDHDARGDQVNGHLRYAYSYNGSAAKAPLLTCNYIPKLDYHIFPVYNNHIRTNNLPGKLSALGY